MGAEKPEWAKKRRNRWAYEWGAAFVQPGFYGWQAAPASKHIGGNATRRSLQFYDAQQEQIRRCGEEFDTALPWGPEEEFV